MEKPLDQAYDKFVAEVTKAFRENKKALYFAGQTLMLSFEPGEMEANLKVTINGKPYVLANNSPHRAAVAADGLLGERFRFKGQRMLAQIEFHAQKREASQKRIAEEKERRAQHEAARARAQEHIKRLWGPYAQIVWSLGQNPAAHVSEIASVSCTMLKEGLTPDQLPSSALEAHQLYKVEELTGFDWLSVVQLVTAIYEAKKALKG